MSLLSYESQLRLQSSNEPSSSIVKSTLPPAQFDLSSYSKKLNKPSSLVSQNKNSPKIPSNLVIPCTLPDNDNNTEISNIDSLDQQKEQLVKFVNEKEQILLSARNEYNKQYENIFTLTKKFQIEKLKNLKLSFKNQILKQKIYFESELTEISKECERDMYEAKVKSSVHKHLLRVFKQDMRQLLDYMREALVSSGDTLIEAYEACHVLKSLEKLENNTQKQYLNMKNSTSNLLKNNENPVNDSKKTLNRQFDDDEAQFNNYKHEMDELIHILDDIELQHLQRKDQLTTKKKFFNKLKSKFKFIETKYDLLNRQCENLKEESNVYKQLYTEKQLTIASNSEFINFCDKCSTSSSLAPSTGSRSSSVSDLSEANQQLIEQSDEYLEELEDIAYSSSSSSSSSSSLHQDEDEHFLLLEEDYSTSSESNSTNNIHDYNRKLDIVKNLINLHVAKSLNSKECTTTTSSTLLSINNLWRQSQTTDNSFNFMSETNQILTQAAPINIRHTGERQRNNSCSLDLSDCSLDGDKVIIENSSLKQNCNLSGWCLTRQIEQMPNDTVKTHKLPSGSLVKSGKVLRVHTPFQSDPLEFLLAIRYRNRHFSTTQTANKKNKLNLKIYTKLLSPDGCVKAVHTQEIPQFYEEIFKYANLIQLL